MVIKPKNRAYGANSKCGLDETQLAAQMIVIGEAMDARTAAAKHGLTKAVALQDRALSTLMKDASNAIDCHNGGRSSKRKNNH